MISKLNSIEIQNYSNDFAKVICDEFFRDKPFVSGSDILNLTEIKQLNLFIIKELYQQWHTEMAKLKSPYFDFDSVDVLKATDDYMNVLSRNIRIDKKNFEPLLAAATSQTLDLYYNPNQYFNEQLRTLPEFKLDKEWLKTNGKFFKSYGWILKELLERLNGMAFVYANEAIDWVNDLLTPDKTESHEKELNDFQQILAFKASEVLVEKPKKYNSFFDEIESVNVIRENPKTEKSVSSTLEHEKNSDEKRALIEKALNDITNGSINKETNNVSNETSSNHSILEIQTMSEVHKVEVSTSEIKIKDDSQTLNDKHSKNGEVDGNSLSDFHAKRKIETIKGNISLNQKFLFTNNLFGGKDTIFSEAVNELELCSTFAQAKDQMLKKYMPKFNWDLNSPEAEEFFELLKRRYN